MKDTVKLWAAFAWLTLTAWWWVPCAVVLGVAMWLLFSAGSGSTAPVWVHIGAALIGAGGAYWAHNWLEGRTAHRTCPHPGHRIRHFHVAEPRGPVAQCEECGHRFRDWPGGHHDATRCWTS